MDEAELEAYLADQGLTLETVYSTEKSKEVKLVLISIIPELLLAPDISQGDYSIKYKIDGIKSYYSILCGEVGLPDIYNPTQDSIVDRSDVW